MASAMQTLGLPLSPLGMGLVIFCLAGIAAIAVLARREFSADLKLRRGMLDEAAGLLADPRVTIGSDGYPRLSGLRDGKRVSMEVVADSLVPRRLPQLWLKLSLHSREARGGPSIGVLARPVGAEFYSRVLGLPDTLRPTFKADFSLLMRGRDVTEAAMQGTSELFRKLFVDPTLKEIIITPRGCGLVRQIAEGDRGAHILYRQMRFPVHQVPSSLVRTALVELDLLDDALQAEPIRVEEKS
jgi:hypothetical protein